VDANETPKLKPGRAHAAAGVHRGSARRSPGKGDENVI